MNEKVRVIRVRRRPRWKRMLLAPIHCVRVYAYHRWHLHQSHAVSAKVAVALTLLLVR